MSDIFVEIEAFDLETGNIKTFKYKDMQFSYRESVLKNNPRYFVVSTLVDLIPRGGEYESHTPESLRAARKEKQPAGFSCGSFFKNPV